MSKIPAMPELEEIDWQKPLRNLPDYMAWLTNYIKISEEVILNELPAKKPHPMRGLLVLERITSDIKQVMQVLIDTDINTFAFYKRLNDVATYGNHVATDLINYIEAHNGTKLSLIFK